MSPRTPSKGESGAPRNSSSPRKRLREESAGTAQASDDIPANADSSETNLLFAALRGPALRSPVERQSKKGHRRASRGWIGVRVSASQDYSRGVGQEKRKPEKRAESVLSLFDISPRFLRKRVTQARSGRESLPNRAYKTPNGPARDGKGASPKTRRPGGLRGGSKISSTRR